MASGIFSMEPGICRERREGGTTVNRNRKRARHICRAKLKPPAKQHMPFRSLLNRLVTSSAVDDLPRPTVPADEHIGLAPRKPAVVVSIAAERDLDVVACRRVEFERESKHARVRARLLPEFWHQSSSVR